MPNFGAMKNHLKQPIAVICPQPCKSPSLTSAPYLALTLNRKRRLVILILSIPKL